MTEKISFTFGRPNPTTGTSPPTGTATAAASVPTSIPSVAPELESFDLFPTRIWQARLTPLVPHLHRWVQTVLDMRAAAPKPAGRTVRRGWNSADMAVLERPDFAPLKYAIHAACARAISDMGEPALAFGLQSWINLHDRGGFNFLHLHEGSLLSGSFYLQVPPGSGEFVFRDPRSGVIHGSFKGAAPNSHSDIHLSPSTGLLVLFPCWMEHYVEPHDSDDARITIAFNALKDAPGAAR